MRYDFFMKQFNFCIVFPQFLTTLPMAKEPTILVWDSGGSVCCYCCNLLTVLHICKNFSISAKLVFLTCVFSEGCLNMSVYFPLNPSVLVPTFLVRPFANLLFLFTFLRPYILLCLHRRPGHVQAATSHPSCALQ